MDNKTVLGNRGVLERAYCNIAVTCNALVLCILIAAYTISALQEHDYFSAETQSVIHTHTHTHTHAPLQQHHHHLHIILTRLGSSSSYGLETFLSVPSPVMLKRGSGLVLLITD